jgi:hypothetical protein
VWHTRVAGAIRAKSCEKNVTIAVVSGLKR